MILAYVGLGILIAGLFIAMLGFLGIIKKKSSDPPYNILMPAIIICGTVLAFTGIYLS